MPTCTIKHYTTNSLGLGNPGGGFDIDLNISIPEYERPTLSPEIGANATYLGFGGSTGGATNEHWLHYMRWESIAQTVEFDNGPLSLLSNYTLTGNASVQSVPSISITGKTTTSSFRLTQAVGNRSGNVFYDTPVYVMDNQGDLIDWSCFFVMTTGGGSGADGMCLMLQSNNTAIGGPGGGLGYATVPNCVAVGIDTWQNPPEPADDHIEIAGSVTGINSHIHPNLAFATVADVEGTTGTNKLLYTWVEYTGGTMHVYFAINSSTKPGSPTLSHTFDIRDYLETI